MPAKINSAPAPGLVKGSATLVYAILSFSLLLLFGSR